MGVTVGYEVDLIGVGRESRSGDAIAVRWGNLFGTRDEQRVVIIDGGFHDSGQDVVNHIKGYYGTDKIDAVISTHPDQDHVNGLHVVLQNLTVRELWIHKPWEHNQGLADVFLDGRVTDTSIGRRLRESLDSASDLILKAEEKGIAIVEPFVGISLYNEEQLCVLGPTKNYYESLISDFDGMPATRSTNNELMALLVRSVGKALRRFTSSWGVDALDDVDSTSAKNNSSVITQLTVDGHRLLFTGDAGVTALSNASDELDPYHQEAELRLIQIPHHGSRRNVSPTVLNRLIGEPLPEGQTRSVTAIASTARNSEPKHPRKAVMNAFTHRGVKALATRGTTMKYSHDAPARDGWNPVAPDIYYWEYEDED